VRDQGNTSTSWDGSWEVKTSVTESGWSAEFRIPLRTLRYGPAPQTWGVNLFRNIQRHRERSYWAPLARIRHGSNFTINTTWNYRSITLPQGPFTPTSAICA
jgi:hypothetical protein